MTSELPVTRWQAAEKGRPDVKWQMADVKTLGFCHLPSDIRHSGCVFQHPAWSGPSRKLEAGSWKRSGAFRREPTLCLALEARPDNTPRSKTAGLGIR